MPLRFLHTADWHWGRFPLRLETHAAQWEQLWELARQKYASFVLVAGGFFASETPAESVWMAALEALQKAPVPIVLMPGRRDPDCEGSIWQNGAFTCTLAAMPQIYLALSTRPIALAGAQILPFPLTRFGQTSALPSGERGAILRIGMVSVAPENLGPHVAAKSGFDYLALGGIGAFREAGERSFFAGGAEVVCVQLGSAPVIERLVLEGSPEQTGTKETESPVENPDFAALNLEPLEAEILKILDTEFDLRSLQGLSQAEKIAFWSAEPSARDAARRILGSALQS